MHGLCILLIQVVGCPSNFLTSGANSTTGIQYIFATSQYIKYTPVTLIWKECVDWAQVPFLEVCYVHNIT
jgi:hypothetical protein